MFDFLRRMIVPIMIIALIGFLATIVFQWGMDISSRDRFVSENTAAVINGEEVTWLDFNRTYNQLYEMQTAGMDLDEDLTDFQKKQLRDAAWQQILHDRLLMQEAAKYKVTVSDDELYAYLRFTPPQDIQQMPYFQTDGVFDYQKYRSAMADPTAAPFWASIEPIMRKEILKQKLQAMVIQATQVSDEEMKYAFLADREMIKLGIANVPYSRFESLPDPTDDQLKEFCDTHAGDYAVDERAILNLVRLSKEPTDYDWEVDSATAAQLYDSIVTAGADFAELATFYSEDVTAEVGGDLNWFEQGMMVEPFDKKVFSMKPGEVSEPVKTQFGWHIIKLHEFRDKKVDSKTIKEAHASHILIKVTASLETLDRIHNRLTDFKMQAGEYGFAEKAEEYGLEVIKTAPFTEGALIDSLGYEPDVTEFAFNNEPGALSPVFENRNWVYVVQVVNRLPSGLADFADVRDQIAFDYEQAVLKGLSHDTAAAIYAETQAGTSLKNAAKNHGAEYKTPDASNRNSYITGLGTSVEAIGVAFSLTQPGQISQPVDYGRGSAVLELIERMPADVSEFAAKRDSVYQAILAAKQQELYGLWFEELVENSDIVNNIEVAYKAGGDEY